MQFTRAEANLLRRAELQAARGGVRSGKDATKARRLKAQVATQMLRHQQVLARRAAVYNVPIPNQRLLEHKTFDAIASVVVESGNDTAPASTPFAPVATKTGGCINQVPIGNSSITRVGRRFSNNAVAIRGHVTSGSTTKVAHATMFLIWDRNVNQSAALPAWTTILTSQTSAALTNKDNAPRFKILRRWDYVLTGNDTTAAQSNDTSMIYIDEFVKMKNKVTLFTAADSTGSYPDMVEGGLLLYCTSNVIAGTTSPQFTLSTRLYFADH